MGFEDIEERIEWEARRVAAAFEVEEWNRRQFEGKFEEEFCRSWTLVGLGRRDCIVEIVFYNQGGPDVPYLGIIQVWPKAVPLCDRSLVDGCSVGFCPDEGRWGHRSSSPRTIPLLTQSLAQGLYCLGIVVEPRAVRFGLPSLSAHEKMELRLSMPREFWPKSWLEEEES